MKKISKLEKRVISLEKRYKILWMRHWTRLHRREKLYRKRDAQLRKWVRSYSHLKTGGLIRLGKILSGIEQNRHIMTLSSRHYLFLWRWLRKSEGA